MPASQRSRAPRRTPRSPRSPPARPRSRAPSTQSSRTSPPTAARSCGCWATRARGSSWSGTGRTSATLSLEGVSQMDSIPPGRLLTLVRPGNDLVLRRIRNLKRCAQACGCNITTTRYACNLPPGCISSEPSFAGLRKNKKKRGEKMGPKKRVPKKGKRDFLWQSLTSLEMQPGGKLQAYLVVVMLQPHACAQRFRFRILRRTRSFPGRTSVRSLPGGIESVWETPSKERGGLVNIDPLLTQDDSKLTQY